MWHWQHAAAVISVGGTVRSVRRDVLMGHFFYQAAVPSLSPFTYSLVDLNRVHSRYNLWRGENNADADGVVATEAEPLIVAVVAVVEVVGGAEDTGAKIMWRDTKQIPILPLMI